ncbi:hypothetical protein QCA50_010116 [Cerrena zonata]|uniref:Anaphase-promoting complex subunit 4-like WD40 domain-containing protein n=1 Tax=Cerrena zonata TaxID=2478898 RepID=A0AAW0FZK8_9APHY
MTGTLVATLTGHKNWTSAVAFSPDSQRIITGSEDHTSIIWDARSGDELVTICEHKKPVRVAEFSPDGKEVLTGSGDSIVCINDSLLGTRKHGWARNGDPYVTSACYSPDGKFVIVGYGSGNIRIRNTETGLLVADWEGHGDRVISVTADNKNLVSICEGGSIRIWEMANLTMPRDEQGA